MKLHCCFLVVVLTLCACNNNKKIEEKQEENANTSKITLVAQKPSQLALSDYEQQIQNQPLDEFLNYSFRQLLLRDPERVLYEGLAQQFEYLVPTYTDISPNYRNETTAFYQATLAKLKTYDLVNSTKIQQQNYDVYLWWLEDQLALMAYPEFRLGAMHSLELMNFFLGLHPITNEQDAVNYIDRLSGLADQFASKQAQMNERAAKGVIDPKILLEHVISQLTELSNLSVNDDPIYQYFNEALEKTSLTDEQKTELKGMVSSLLTNQIKPAQKQFTEALASLLPQAPTEIGLSQYPLGEEYYNQLLSHHVTLPLSSDQLYQQGIDEITRIHQEMKATFFSLGYSEELDIEKLFQAFEADALVIEKNNVVSAFEELVAVAETRLSGAFNLPEVVSPEVVDSFQDGYFPAARDGSEQGRFVTNATSDRFYYQMPSLAYHEAVPGHHLQSTIAQSIELPLLRTLPPVTAYVEGWALYVESLAFELGWYTENPAGNLGRLQWDALRAARLVADIGVNSLGWSWEEAQSFMSRNTGLSESAVSGFVGRFVVNPGQSTAYTMGMLEILKLRKQLEQAQGIDFSLSEFHNIILNSGPMPLPVLAKQFDDLISD